jgi:hypothetical protein
LRLIFYKRVDSIIDLSCASSDGSQTPAKNGGEAASYQRRKACKTTNSLFICKSIGVMLAVGFPQRGNPSDLYEIRALFEKILGFLRVADAK